MSERKQTDDFTLGYLCAAAEVQRRFDEPTIAYQLMMTAGVDTKALLRKTTLEDFDRKPLRYVLGIQGAR